MKRRGFKILFFLITCVNGLLAQENISVFFNDTCWNSKMERVYVHIPQRTLVAGQQMFFKAYLFNTSSELRSDNTSSVVYFDIVSNKGRKVWGWKSFYKNGFCGGVNSIPDTISTGMYIFRAYTGWMLNAGSEYIFQMPVFISNMQEDSKEAFPIMSKVQDINSNNNKTSAITIKTNSQKGGILADINDKSGQIGNNFFAFFNGTIIKNKALEESENKIRLELPANKKGLVFCIVTNKYLEIIEEKTVLYCPEEQSAISIEGLKDTYAPDEIMELKVTIDTNLFALTSNYSCSITRESDPDLIKKYPSLEDYYYIFNQLPAEEWFLGDSGMANSDWISSTTWENSLWNQEVISSEKNCIYPKENQAWVLSGQVFNKKGHKPLSSVLISMSMNNTQPQIRFAHTNNQGEFYFWVDSAFYNQDLIFKIVDDSVNSNSIIWKYIQNNPATINYANSFANFDVNQNELIEEVKQLYLIDSYYNSFEVKLEEKRGLTESFIQYMPDYIRRPDDYSELETFEDVVKNILPLVVINQKDNKAVLEIQNNDRNGNLQDPLLLINGIPFYDMNVLMKFEPENIEDISVYKSKIFFGDFAFPGIIQINTKDDTDEANLALNNTFLVENRMIPLNRQCFSLKKETHHPNVSRLLYWNPDLNFSSDGKYNIKLPVSTLSGTYKLIVEGMNSDGTPLTIEKYFKIEE